MKILDHIHTILLLVGFVLLATGLFLFNPIVGYVVCGILLMVLAFYIDVMN